LGPKNRTSEASAILAPKSRGLKANPLQMAQVMDTVRLKTTMHQDVWSTLPIGNFMQMSQKMNENGQKWMKNGYIEWQGPINQWKKLAKFHPPPTLPTPPPVVLGLGEGGEGSIGQWKWRRSGHLSSLSLTFSLVGKHAAPLPSPQTTLPPYRGVGLNHGLGWQYTKGDRWLCLLIPFCS